jgi:hypothetical protein
MRTRIDYEHNETIMSFMIDHVEIHDNKGIFIMNFMNALVLY